MTARITVDEVGTVRCYDAEGRLLDTVVTPPGGRSVHVPQPCQDLAEFRERWLRSYGRHDDRDQPADDELGGMVVATVAVLATVAMAVLIGIVLLAVRWSS